MKILILHTYNQGYLSNFFFELSVKLSQRKHEVTNFSFKRREYTIEEEGVKVYVFKKGHYFSNYYRIFKIIKHKRPDVILSNFSYVNPALLFGRLFRVPRNLVWFHSLNEQMKSTAWNIFVKRQFLKLADMVVANSTLTQNELQSFYKLPKEKTTAIPFWTNISEVPAETSDIVFNSKPNVLKIGCPGRLVADKNQKVLIDALADIKHRYDHDFQLFIAGTGEDLSSLKALAKQHGISGQTTFLGHLSANDIRSFYKTMDVVVLPSLHEAFGLVFIEAIALGTPVVVSSQFGALSFVKGRDNQVDNIVFDPKSVTALTAKLLPYFKKEGPPRSFFETLYADNFKKDVIFEDILNLIEMNPERRKSE